ncbi:carboxymuconolactone decarboxylase family protein [Oceanicoccus sp. KOV_DT_Chl]|uniref:carboxymuconolactone decarboxylase family protein n=1 Tax=Oceanicoccus sp. KOV_DT_Chl TaxID=1904639 RepID=UPI000C7DACEF|nr:carboxymuconolactone decarboxylase family protein [Oceanicoccus sp. KOV_DT_Chl]
MIWQRHSSQQRGTFGQIFSLRPNLWADYQRFIAVLWQRTSLSVVILELTRLRVAQLHNCKPELNRRYQLAIDAGLVEEKIQQLSQWHTANVFSRSERGCLELAELFVIDPHAISDEVAAAVQHSLGDNGFVALMEALAMFDGFCRFQLMLDVAVDKQLQIIVLED